MNTRLTPTQKPQSARLCVAPMMERTDRHFRYLLRQITRHTLLYSEMITMHAMTHGDIERKLDFDPAERPLALQLGGDDPKTLARCAQVGQQRGYDEINLNIGCPSDRVQKGRIGACLMAEPALVAECVAAMREAVTIPVTVKHRLGIDGHESYEHLTRFVSAISQAGCDRFIVHARVARLTGLSPKQNRSVPPLQYEQVYRLKRDFPELFVGINGGITSLDAAQEHLAHVDGVMIGRSAYARPWMLAHADSQIFGEIDVATSPYDVARAMLPYIEKQVALGNHPHVVSRHMLTLFSGFPRSRLWRQQLSGARPSLETVRTALADMASHNVADRSQP